jgi:GntR family transcriptional regulator
MFRPSDTSNQERTIAMPWRGDSNDKAESGYALLALLLMGPDEQLGRELRRRGIRPAEVSAAVLEHFPGRGAEQAHTAARYIAEAVAAGTMNRDALLRSVLRDYWGVAGQVLRALSERPGAAGPAEERAPLVQVDYSSDRTIFEQIVEQVQESIATGRLLPGERLPTVRELAGQLAVAAGTVARAYAELERQGNVVTQGTRGTRVAERAGYRDSALASPGQLPGMLRPVVVAAYHMGATAEELRSALEAAMADIFPAAEPQ